MNFPASKTKSLHIYSHIVLWERTQPVLSFAVELFLVFGLFLFFGGMATSRLPVAIQWNRIPGYFAAKTDAGNWAAGPFLEGLRQTAKLSALALILTLLIGYFTALLRLSRIASARLLASSYIQMVRNTPLLVQLYVAYFVFSPLFGLNSFLTALLVLSLFEGAYTAEIVRSAIQNIPTGQGKAAMALGLSTLQKELLIVHPQALRNCLPVLANQGVSLVKDSALASAIGVFELSRSAQRIQERTFLPFEPWLGVCIIYFALTFILSLGVKMLERRNSQR